jgi:hypothetical protein
MERWKGLCIDHIFIQTPLFRIKTPRVHQVSLLFNKKTGGVIWVTGLLKVLMLDATEKSRQWMRALWMTSRNACGAFGEEFLENELAYKDL